MTKLTLFSHIVSKLDRQKFNKSIDKYYSNKHQ